MKKIALVTGSAKRIGREIALHLAKNGWKIVIHCNKSIKEARELSKNISDISESIVIQQDLNDLYHLDSIFNDIEKQIGKPSLLINNASLFSRDTKHITPESLTSHMNINCFAQILLAEKFFNSTEGKRSIINIIDSFANTPTKNYLSYNLSKTAMLYATKCLALKFHPNCRVNSISPGMVIEPENKKEQVIFKKLVQTTHKYKKNHINDILKSIDLMLSDSTINGQNVTIENKGKLSLNLTF